MAIIMIDDIEHTIGDKECENCYNYPTKKCECGGLIHTGFGDENSDGDYWLFYKCDKCGSKDNPE